MLLWFPLLLCVHACMQSTQGHVNVCNVLYCSLSCVWESDVSRHPYPIDTHSLSLFNTHTDTHTTRASQLESVRRLNISQWVETWQRHWVHLNVSLCETRGLWKKYTPQNITHTHAHTQCLWEVRKCQTGVSGAGGIVWFGCLPLSDERCHFSSYFMKDEGRGRVIGQRACKVKGCQADVISHLPSLFLHLVCFLHSTSLSLFIISPNLFSLSSFLFHFGVWRHHRPLPAGTRSESIQGYISYY